VLEAPGPVEAHEATSIIAIEAPATLAVAAPRANPSRRAQTTKQQVIRQSRMAARFGYGR